MTLRQLEYLIVWAYAVSVEFSPSAAAFTDVLIKRPWQRHADVTP